MLYLHIRVNIRDLVRAFATSFSHNAKFSLIVGMSELDHHQLSLKSVCDVQNRKKKNMAGVLYRWACLSSKKRQTPCDGGGGGGGGFFLACEDLGRMFDHSFPHALFFFFFVVEIS